MNKFKVAMATVLATTVTLTGVASASAHECFNVSKNQNNPAAGAQVIFGSDDEILFATKGLERRIEKGIVDAETGEGFHGIIAFAEDGEVVGHTFIVTPEGEIPQVAQSSGSPDHGIINICDAGFCE